MSRTSMPRTTIACALLLALSCAACTRPPPPPPEQPPEPQAHARPRNAIQAPIAKKEAVETAAADAAEEQAAIEAVTGS